MQAGEIWFALVMSILCMSIFLPAFLPNEKMVSGGIQAFP